MQKPVLFFDGVCNLCNGAVQLVIQNDPAGNFRYAPLQGETARKLLAGHESLQSGNTFILWDNGEVFTKSEAALRVAGRMEGWWNWLTVFRIIPAFLRDAIYDFISRNRYRWFGRREECMIPRPEWSTRFLP